MGTKQALGDELKIRILMPSQEELIKRDKERESWTTGIDRIEAVSQEFNDIKNQIGENNYIDTTRLASRETADNFSLIVNKF